MSQQYNQAFFNEMHGCPRVVKMVYDLIKPESVIDVGCGNGSWLRDFKDLGVKKYVGIDRYCNDRDVVMPAGHFIHGDLFDKTALLQYYPRDKYGLAVCVEVAEHIEPGLASLLIKRLTELAPVILWSAAIPGQGGVDHVNCQWFDYWQKHFQERDYLCFDPFRKAIWEDRNIEWWYRQNLLLYAKRDYLKDHPNLRNYIPEDPFERVHPENLTSCCLYPQLIYPGRRYVYH